MPILNKGNAKVCSNYHTIAHISHTSKVMLKILQARIQQCVNQELPDVQAGLRKGRGTRTNCQHLLDHWKSKKIPEKHHFCFTDYTKAFDCVDHNKLWEILKWGGNTRSPYLPSEMSICRFPRKSVCRSRSNS